MERRGKKAGKRVLRFAVSSSLLVQPALGCGGQEQEPTVNEPAEEQPETTVTETTGTAEVPDRAPEDIRVNEREPEPPPPRPIRVNQVAERVDPPVPTPVSVNERPEPHPVPQEVHPNLRAPEVSPQAVHANPGPTEAPSDK